MRASRIASAWLCVSIIISIIIAVAGMVPTAAARVGVTSETNGDPLGKPPTEDERVLRMGIDIQADELITTRADDRAHVVFLDGTSLTVSPNAQLKIDRFIYDPQSRRGDLAITATKGVFRLVGGKISKTSAITITTPSSTIGIRGGIGLFTVDGGHTTARFLFGNSLQVTAGGQTQTAVRPGSEIRTMLGGVPGVPSMIPPGGLVQTLQAFEAHPGSSSSSGGAGGSGGTSPDEHARSSGFSQENSGRGTGGPGLALAPGQIEKLSQAISGQVLSQARPTITLPTQTTTNTSGPVVQPVVSPVISSTPPPPPPPPPPTTITSGPGCYDFDDRYHRSFFRR